MRNGQDQFGAPLCFLLAYFRCRQGKLARRGSNLLIPRAADFRQLTDFEFC